jgi:hypothetical protein
MKKYSQKRQDLATGLATVEPCAKRLAGPPLLSTSGLEPFIKLDSEKNGLISQKDLDLHPDLNKDGKKLRQSLCGEVGSHFRD